MSKHSFVSNVGRIMSSVFCVIALQGTAFAQTTFPGSGGGLDPTGNTVPPEPIVDWQRKQNENGRLEQLDFGLLGDRIEPHTGALSFEHTDVSLPGNSSLDVSVRRRIRTGGLYHPNVKAEFGDWELITPRIKVTTSNSSNYRTGNRCSELNQLQTVQVPYPAVHTFSGNVVTVQKNQPVRSNEYSSGYMLDVPGYGEQQMFKRSTNSSPAYGDSDFATKDGWKVDCISNITGGGEGYEATAPNGTVYRFDRFYEIEAPRLGFLGHTSSEFDRFVSIVAATQATDVHGNTVDYTYDASNRLEKIEAGDGRVITLSYTGGTDMISRVTANELAADERHWDYTYGTNTLNYYARFEPYLGGGGGHYGGGSTFVGSYPTLTTVTQPDGQSWTFDMEAMSAEVPSALSCIPETFPVSVTHPHGTSGSFLIGPLKHKVTGRTLSPKPNNVIPGYCPNPEANTLNSAAGSGDRSISEYYAPVWMMSTTAKTLTYSNSETSGWSYEYELDQSLWGANDDQLNRTDVTNPDGTITRYFHGWGTEPIVGNQLVRQQTLQNDTVIQDIEYSYIWEDDIGVEGLSGGLNYFYPRRSRRQIKSVISQDGDTFTTETSYNTDQSSTDYSFGQPISMRSYSNVNTDPRGTDTEYVHNTSAWIIGLPETIYEVATDGSRREVVSYSYNEKGLRTSLSRYGQSDFMTFTYNSDGTMASYKDALDRETEAHNWHRGTPQLIKQAAHTSDPIQTEQEVDDNGWVISSKDAKGYETKYGRDDMGRMTEFDPVGDIWAETSISYVFPSTGGAVQTITKGASQTTITYDSLFRPILEKTDDTGTTWESYVNTKYDAMGRVIFKSQPSDVSDEAEGVITTYDGLGRVKTVTETASGGVTQHYYSSGHVHRVNDPKGYNTFYTSRGYDGPGNKDYSQITEHGGQRATKLHKNIWGELNGVQQAGTHNGFTSNQWQQYFYDAQRRVCGYRDKEGGDILYQYDDAGQLIAYAKGQSNASSDCPLPSGTAKVNLTYDNLGRLKNTNFNDPNTPDIERVYDKNGNVLQVNRRLDLEADRDTALDAVNWTYTYNSLNLLELGVLKIDNRTYTNDYAYNSHGHLKMKRTPGQITRYDLDGLGRILTANKNHETVKFASNVEYHPDGSVSSFTYGNGLEFTRSLNNRLMTQQLLTQKPGGRTFVDLQYSYDARGLITTQIDGVNHHNSRGYTYDRLGQLTEATAGLFGGDATYKYDSLGNIRERTLGSRTISLKYDDRNRVYESIDSGATGTRTVDYDARGNVTTLGSMAFYYDMSDQPTSVTGTADGTGVANGTYVYDGNMKRVKSVVNGKTIYNVYDQAGTLAFVHELDGNKTTDYVSGPMGTVARVVNGQPTYVHSDHLGSPRELSNAAGVNSGYAHYSPFGLEVGPKSLPNDQAGFTGHIKDSATGLNYMQARYYDPVIGRFLSIDPVTFLQNGNPAQFNRYSYTWNDPINGFDPDGRETRLMVEAHHLDMDVVNGNMTMGERNDISKAQFNGMVAGATMHPAGRGISLGANAAKAGIVAKVGWQARSVRSLSKTAPGLTRAHTKSINKIRNVISDNLKPSDFKGVKAELKGIDTGFDHVTEMKQSLTALTKSSKSLAGSLKNPNLTKAQRSVLSNAQKRADQAIKRMDKALGN